MEKSIKLRIDDVLRNGRYWVVVQMVDAGIRLYPYSWRSDGQYLIIDGVVA